MKLLQFAAFCLFFCSNVGKSAQGANEAILQIVDKVATQIAGKEYIPAHDVQDDLSELHKLLAQKCANESIDFADSRERRYCKVGCEKKYINRIVDQAICECCGCCQLWDCCFDCAAAGYNGLSPCGSCIADCFCCGPCDRAFAYCCKWGFLQDDHQERHVPSVKCGCPLTDQYNVSALKQHLDQIKNDIREANAPEEEMMART